jgi:thiamine biosynthesis lipoprotein
MSWGRSMNRTGRFVGVLVVLSSLICTGLLLTKPHEWRFTARAMGTSVSVSLVGTPMEKFSGKLSRLFESVLGEIENVENIMSIYRAESDVSRLNNAVAGGEVSIDEHTYEVVRAAVGLSRLTGGAFDICILSAEQAWGFKTERRRRVPGPALSRPGFATTEDISLSKNGDQHSISFLKEGMKIDLGGIAKGYAVDRAVAALKENGATSALVEIGGDCYCLGANSEGRPWRLGLRHPRRAGVLTVLHLSNRAAATSGDYEDFFFERGKRYSHIFDPRTGRPAEHGIISATIISDSCMDADSLATAVTVMGKEKGLELVEKLSDTECILVSEEDGFTISTSSGQEW